MLGIDNMGFLWALSENDKHPIILPLKGKFRLWHLSSTFELRINSLY